MPTLAEDQWQIIFDGTSVASADAGTAPVGTIVSPPSASVFFISALSTYFIDNITVFVGGFKPVQSLAFQDIPCGRLTLSVVAEIPSGTPGLEAAAFVNQVGAPWSTNGLGPLDGFNISCSLTVKISGNFASTSNFTVTKGGGSSVSTALILGGLQAILDTSSGSAQIQQTITQVSRVPLANFFRDDVVIVLRMPDANLSTCLNNFIAYGWTVITNNLPPPPGGGAASIPNTPANFRVFAAGATQVTLSWAVSTGATTYNIYRATVSGQEGSTPYQTGITTNIFTDQNLTPGTTYFYQVTAVNNAGESPKSNEVQFAATAGRTGGGLPPGPLG